MAVELAQGQPPNLDVSEKLAVKGIMYYAPPLLDSRWSPQF